MDIPQPPDDQEQRNIIDKLAQFVARNGPEFEKMTRVKQRKNPKFAFLFHGEFFNYYQYKVTTEQQILKQQQSRMSGTVGGGGNSQGPPPWQQQQQQQDATEPLPQNLPPWRKLPQGPSGGPTQNLPPWQQGPSPQAQSGAPPLPPWQQSGSPGGGPSQALPHPWQQGPPPPPWQQGPPPIGPGLGGVSPWPQGAPAAGATLPPWQQASQVPSGAPPPWQQQGQGSPGQQGLTPWQQHPPAGASGNSGTEVCATGPQVQEQIQQSLQNLDQQQQHLMQQQQEQIEAALVAAQEQRLQDQASDVQVDLEEFDAVLKPIIDSCTKDAISNGKTWIFSKAKSQEQCTLLADYLKWRIMKPGENFKLHLHLIYLINDVLHHCQRKQAQDLQLSLEKVVVPIFCTAFLGAEEEKQQKLSKLLALWEKNNYFEERIITQLKDPSTSLAQYQAWLVTEFASVVQPIHMSMQQQLKSLQMQHKHFVDHLTQGRPLPVPSVPPTLSPSEGQPTQTSEQGQLEGPSSSGSGSSGEQVPQSAVAVPGPTEVSLDISPSGQQPAFGGQQGNTWQSQQGPFNPQQPPPPWATNPASFGQPPPPPPPPPPPVGNYNQLPPPPGPGGFSQPPLPGFLHGRPPPMPPRVFASPSNDLGPPGPQCPPGAPNHPPAFQLGIPPPGLLEYAQAPPDFSKPPPGFPSIPPPNMSPKAPLQTVDPNDPSLLPTVPYYELPAGLMAPLVKLEECEYRPLDPTDIRLPPPMPPSDRLLEAVRAFYSPASHERPRNSEGWEHNGLYEFFRAKMRARRRRDEQSRNEGHSLSRSRSRSQRSSSSRSESSSSSSSRSHSRSPRRRRSYSRSRSRSRSPRRRRRSRSRSPRHRDSMSHAPPIGIADYRLGEENKGHQLLMKMGWSGAGGLGANEQGREDPIKGGEIRDHWNQYKGIGVPLDDPFENFRRSKSNTFIARLMARTDPLAGNQPTEKPTE